MNSDSESVARLYEGWDGYQSSLTKAIALLSREQLAWRSSPRVRTIGELARHISVARIEWFARMDPQGSVNVAAQITAWEVDSDGNRYITADFLTGSAQAAELVWWLDETWEMIRGMLAAWQVADLWKTYRHTWNGNQYSVSRQWTIWRIMAHDIHHGGQIARILAEQGIEAFELRTLGGHIVLPPLAQPE